MTSELPPPGTEAEPSDDQPPRGRPRRPRAERPNYTARRVAVGSGLLGLIVAAVAVVMVLGNDDDPDVSIDPGWNAIVEVSRTSGEVIVLDDDGDEIARIDGDGRVTDVHVRNDRLALVSPDRVLLRGLDPDDDPTTVEIDPAATVVRHPSNRSFTLLVTPDVGGEIVVIDGTDGTTTEIGARAGQSAPLLLAETLLADRDATRFAVGDGRNFQTIVVDIDLDVEPTFFPGIPMAVGDDLVVTSTNVGRSAELGFFDADGERRALVPTERPVAGVLDTNRFVYVTEEGRVMEASPGESEPDELAALDMWSIDHVHPTLDGRRLVVIGGGRLVVVDLDGGIVHDAELDDTTSLDANRPWHTWRCLPVPTAAEGDGGAIVDLDDGGVVAEIPEGQIGAISTDGCGVDVMAPGDDPTTDPAGGHLIVSRAGTYSPRDPVRSVVLAPDASAALVTAMTGEVELVTLDDGRRLDLGTRRGMLAFAGR